MSTCVPSLLSRLNILLTTNPILTPSDLFLPWLKVSLLFIYWYCCVKTEFGNNFIIDGNMKISMEIIFLQYEPYPFFLSFRQNLFLPPSFDDAGGTMAAMTTSSNCDGCLSGNGGSEVLIHQQQWCLQPHNHDGRAYLVMTATSNRVATRLICLKSMSWVLWAVPFGVYKLSLFLTRYKLSLQFDKKWEKNLNCGLDPLRVERVSVKPCESWVCVLFLSLG